MIKENKKLRQQQQPTIEEHKNLYYPKQPTRPKNIKKIVYEKETDSDSEPDKKETYTLTEVEIEEEPEEEPFFDTFGVDGLNSLIIQDDQKVIEKILLGTEQLMRTDKNIMLAYTKFSLNVCKNLSKNELDNLSDTARDLFYFVQSFGGKLKLRDFVSLWVVEDRIQDLDTVNGGIFQIYFYDNLLNPDQNNKIQKK